MDHARDKLYFLLEALTIARNRYFEHVQPGNLTDIELAAWRQEEEGLFLLLSAAQMRVEAEEKLLALLKLEAVPNES